MSQIQSLITRKVDLIIMSPIDQATSQASAMLVNKAGYPAPSPGHEIQQRKAGFESVIKDHPNLEIVAELQGYASRVKGKTIMETLLQKYGKGQLQALVAENDEMALGASSAIQAADRLGEFKVLIGVNGLKPGLDAVAEGTLTATPGCGPEGHANRDRG
jgi:ABC-type sugar transport system substrate-binding protein